MDVAPASFSSEEDCNASAASLTETEDCIETDSIDHSSTSSAEITETRTSALPILSVDLTDLSTCPPPSSLSDDQKYQILTVVPAPLKQYPVNNQKRRFQPHWNQKFSWIRYSVSKDGVFCASCFLFSRARFNN